MGRIEISVEIDTDPLDGDAHITAALARVRDQLAALAVYDPMVFIKWSAIPQNDPLFSIDELDLIGKVVDITLADDVVVRGMLLDLDNGGGTTVVDEEGILHHCWPRLDISEAK